MHVPGQAEFIKFALIFILIVEKKVVMVTMYNIPVFYSGMIVATMIVPVCVCMPSVLHSIIKPNNQTLTVPLPSLVLFCFTIDIHHRNTALSHHLTIVWKKH